MGLEDIEVINYFKNKENGFYVDVGCYHPIHRNNTHLLHKKGWNGITIDVSKFSVDLFNYLRPNDLNYNFAVSNKNKIVKLYFQKELSQLSTIEYEQAKKFLQGKIKEKEIQALTLDEILSRDKYINKKIDFLNIDVEGAEMDVLKKLDFKQYDPSLICIEILGYRELERDDREKKIKEDYIYKFLVEKGYKKVWSGSSYCSHLFTK